MDFEDITIKRVSSISRQSEHWSHVSYTLFERQMNYGRNALNRHTSNCAERVEFPS